MAEDVKYSIVVPVFNEEELIHETYRQLKNVMDSTGERYELLFVNDGSRDRTSLILQEYSRLDKSTKLLEFSRNFGHQVAITAGMDYSSGEAVVVIDADLQDPPRVILELIAKWKEGYDVVYATRTQRQGETRFKRWTAGAFYRLLRGMTDISIPVDTGDFRLVDRRVCDELKRLPERNRFVRGLVSWVGFRQASVEYVREERLAGETKYPLRKMIKLSLDGLTSFSIQPLKLASRSGGAILLIGALAALLEVARAWSGAASLSGWHIIIVLQLLLSGFILLVIGIAGEYIGRIYDEARGRPLYIVSRSYGVGVQESRIRRIV